MSDAQGRDGIARRGGLAPLALAVLGAALVAAGWLLADAGAPRVCEGLFAGAPRNLRRCTRYLFPAARAGGLQLGAVLLAGGLLWLAGSRLWPERTRTLLSRLASVSLGLGVVLGISFATGEIALRLFFWDGVSFGTHAGPLVRRFERDFEFNRFDGPSRGPQVEGPKQDGWTRILVQGDSITWGQGVKPESRLYSEQLLARLRASNPQIELAVLAYGGREIDGHLAQLRKWGAEIEPDAIVYQWFINDIELGKQDRPQPELPWRHLFLHPLLASTSFLWFFIDQALVPLWPTGTSYEGYAEYIGRSYAPGTPGWARFEEAFGEWAGEARRLTPRVLVALYPRTAPPDSVLFLDVHARMRELGAAHGVEVLDLLDALRVEQGHYEALWASRYDPHPSARAHELIAAALDERLQTTWPELLR